ncbi:nuclear transport factor 2 family protein [Mangrovimicrobium sediminis]|uniref:Nuclear transport factor 2 family protein n=1 Tax=Mangrovimicrobium sediminis TaxID=2562682 RepID=A0A4Z0LZL0_9GAMM|nr:nuclear transport factor 2 family protein [Haliea sp. SAOS-164]TGD72709.1 nuclear transport factor 2 family protein [Haliea sp. SAOS-164]
MQADRIADYLAICDTKARYCRCLDTKDWDGFANVFTEDLRLDTTPAGGVVTEGREATLQMVRGSLDNAQTAHQVHTPEIHFDGDSADVIWAMQDRVVWDAERAAQIGMRGLTGYGHYHEHYVKCADGQWRIARQKLTRLLVDIDPVAAA